MRERAFPSDDELLKRIRTEDEEATYQFNKRYTGLVNRVVRGRIWQAGCDHHSDVCIEVWDRVFKKIKRGGELTSVPGFIARTALNESYRHLTAAHKRQPEMLSIESGDIRQPPARGTSTEEEIEAADLLGKALVKVAATWPKFPEMFDLRTDGFSYKEIADVMCETPEKVKYVYLHGLHRLRKILKDELGR